MTLHLLLRFILNNIRYYFHLVVIIFHVFIFYIIFSLQLLNLFYVSGSYNARFYIYFYNLI